VRPSRLGEAIRVSPGFQPRANPGHRSPIAIRLSLHLKAGTEPRHYVRIPNPNRFAISAVVALRATAGHGGTRATF
jgi:hypothetical protein